MTASEEAQSTSSTAGPRKNSGKEFVPEFDGASSMREYQRRVRLFESTTSIDKCFQAGRLVERMSGQAWKATETLDIASLKCDEGVQILLDHLWAELELLEFVRVFKTLHGFYEQFKRQKGQDVISYDSAFRAQVKLLEEVGAGIEGLTKGYWFLAKADITEDMRQKIVSASGGSYEYEKLRDALAAISPTVSRAESGADKDTGYSRLWKGRRFDHRVNTVGDFGDDDSENEALAIEAEAQDEMAMAEAMEQEASVLMTQAAKRRSMFERARGFQKAESSEERAKRISNMKQRMPCNACRAHGKTVYGHWRSDKECPYYDETKKKKEKGAFITESGHAEEDHAAFVVGQASSEEDDGQDDDAFIVHGTGLGQKCLREESMRLGLSDTCCAKTVAGEAWVKSHVEKLKKSGLPFRYMSEREPFRFGGGPKIFSARAVLFPLCIPGCRVPVMLRASIVDQDVPLLISRGALQAMGVIMNLVDSSMRFEKLGCSTNLITTSTGHVGFYTISDNAFDWPKEVDWTAAEIHKEGEIFFGENLGQLVQLRTGTGKNNNPSCNMFPEPPKRMRGCRDAA